MLTPQNRQEEWYQQIANASAGSAVTPLTPWNRQEEWYNEIIDSAKSGGIPAIQSGDEGKVLTVGQAGAPEWDNVPSDLPAVSSADNGKFLCVVDGAWAVVDINPSRYTYE